jgi:hypothetical protein
MGPEKENANESVKCIGQVDGLGEGGNAEAIFEAKAEAHNRFVSIVKGWFYISARQHWMVGDSRGA